MHFKKKFLAALMISVLMVQPLVVNADTEYYNRSGTIDGSYYVYQMYGNTTKLTAATTYGADYTARSVSIIGYYYDIQEDGTSTYKSKSIGSGGSSGRVSATISLTGSNRFVEAQSTHMVSNMTTKTALLTIK